LAGKPAGKKSPETFKREGRGKDDYPQLIAQRELGVCYGGTWGGELIVADKKETKKRK